MKARRAWRRLIADHWESIDAEREPAPPGRLDPRVPIVLLTVAVSLTVQIYWGERPTFVARFPPEETAWAGDYYDLWQFVWWVGWRVIGYVVLPLLALPLMGMRLRDCFVGFGALGRHLWIYAALFLLVLPAVVFASRLPSFQTTYPFYKWANRSAFDFWAWQALYAIQFVSLEFFFRGFVLAGLRRSMGAGAIFVMVVPYCMIHYGKPMTETLAAIPAGIALGTLALRTRSIWGGVALHVAVALAMDALALAHCPDASTGLPCPSHLP